MTISTYDRGDVPTLSVICTVDGIATDPTTLVCIVKSPDRTSATYTLVTTPPVVRDGTGAYHLDLPVTQSGIHRYRWEGTGAAQGAEEGRFDVRKSGVLS